MGENDMDFAERIATLEQLARQANEDREDMKACIHAVQDTLNQMREELAKYRGFWGGAMLVAGAVWAFITLAWDWLHAQVTGSGS